MARSLRHLAVGVFAIASATAVVAGVAVVVAAASRTEVPDAAGSIVVLGSCSLVTGAVGLFVALRRPSNRVAWILLLGALSVALVMAAVVAAALLLEDDPDSTAGRWAAVVMQQWPVLFLWPLALAYVFPDGELPTGRQRLLTWLAVISAAGLMSALFLTPRPEGPYGEVASPLPVSIDEGVLLTVVWVSWFGLLAALVGGAVVLCSRYRRSGPERRRQILWLAYGAVIPPLYLGGSTLVARLTGWEVPQAGDALVLVLMQVWPAVAVAIAVTRHGLYAIDRLFNRTLVYAALTLLVVGTYALVALTAGAVLGGSSALSASVATLVAALAFRPLHVRVQQQVDRRFARSRFEARRLLRDFLDDVREGRAEPEDVGAVAAIALDDRAAEIVFRLPETGAYADRAGRLLDALPADGRAREVIGRDLGVLLHSPAPARGPDVVRAVVDAAAVPVELARLRVELRLQLAEVESSRARIARAGYEERRRIERDLHDGAQQRLVTLGIVLRRLQRSLPREARQLSPALDAAVAEIAAAIADLRTLAAGVRPPRLDEGLSAALEDLARGAGVPVSVDASTDRAPPEIEAAAYFVACEALTNAVKHSSAGRVVVQATRENGALRLTVSDDGVGGAAPAAGSGLRGIVDRVEAQGGTVAIESPVGAGTRIAVELPCAS